MLFGRGPALQSLGCGSICPNSRAKIPVFDANLYVYLHHTGTSLPDGNYDTMTGVGAGEQERKKRDKDGCFPLFFFAYMRSNEHSNAAGSWQARLMICH